MNRLKQLRQEKHLNIFELVESIRHIAPTMTAKEWILYEKEGIKRGNDEFWKKVADWFEVDLGYLYGYSKIRNDKYIIDTQDLINENFKLKLEYQKLVNDYELVLKENQEMTEDLYNIDVVVNDFKERNHIAS